MTLLQEYLSFFRTMHQTGQFYLYAAWPVQDKNPVWLYLHQLAPETTTFTEVVNVFVHTQHPMYGALRVEKNGQQGILMAMAPDTPDFYKALSVILTDVDWGIVDALPRFDEKGLLVMDMDSTAIAMECIDAIAQDYGCGNHVQAITERAMQGQLSFEDSLQQRLHCLKGMPYQRLETMAEDLPIRTGLKALVDDLQQKNWSVIAVSGGFAPFTTELHKQLGLDAIFGNTLDVENGCLTGTVQGELIDACAKAKILTQWMQHLSISRMQVIAIGDGANDLKMLAGAGIAIGMHAKPCVREHVRMHIHRDDFAAVHLCCHALHEVQKWQ